MGFLFYPNQVFLKKNPSPYILKNFRTYSKNKIDTKVISQKNFPKYIFYSKIPKNSLEDKTSIMTKKKKRQNLNYDGKKKKKTKPQNPTPSPSFFWLRGKAL